MPASFMTGAQAARFEDLDLGSDDAGWNLAVGERDGRAYLLDTAFLLSDDPDLVVALSRDLGATVAGAGAETVSGDYWFHVATDGVVRRAHWNSYDAVSEPFDRGDPLPTEADAPIEDLDGDGIMAALADLGFDVATWSDTGPVARTHLHRGPVSGGARRARRCARSPLRGPQGRRAVQADRRPAGRRLRHRSPVEPDAGRRARRRRGQGQRLGLIAAGLAMRGDRGRWGPSGSA